ncbi:MAG: SsrA-binding protein [Acutalibacteraceae bacterium]
MRQGRVNLKDSWCSIVKGELFINGMHISPYEQETYLTKIYACKTIIGHKREIMRLYGHVNKKDIL